VAPPAQGLPALGGRLSAEPPLAGSFETIVHDPRAPLRFVAGKQPEPTAAIFDGRTVPSTPESGGRAGCDGYKRKRGSKVHMSVDAMGHLLALHVTPANEPERDQVASCPSGCRR
jgi:hypothetical protein